MILIIRNDQIIVEGHSLRTQPESTFYNKAYNELGKIMLKTITIFTLTTLSALILNASWTFSEPEYVQALETYRPNDVHSCDIDNDGDQDILVA